MHGRVRARMQEFEWDAQEAARKEAKARAKEEAKRKRHWTIQKVHNALENLYEGACELERRGRRPKPAMRGRSHLRAEHRRNE